MGDSDVLSGDFEVEQLLAPARSKTDRIELRRQRGAERAAQQLAQAQAPRPSRKNRRASDKVRGKLALRRQAIELRDEMWQAYEESRRMIGEGCPHLQELEVPPSINKICKVLFEAQQTQLQRRRAEEEEAQRASLGRRAADRTLARPSRPAEPPVPAEPCVRKQRRVARRQEEAAKKKPGPTKVWEDKAAGYETLPRFLSLPQDPAELLKRAVAARRQNDHATAAAAMAAVPHRSAGQDFLYADDLRLSARPRSAAREFEALLQRHPEHHEARLALAGVYRELERPSDVARVLPPLLAVPEYADRALAELAEARITMGDSRKAVQLFADTRTAGLTPATARLYRLALVAEGLRSNDSDLCREGLRDLAAMWKINDKGIYAEGAGAQLGEGQSARVRLAPYSYGRAGRLIEALYDGGQRETAVALLDTLTPRAPQGHGERRDAFQGFKTSGRLYADHADFLRAEAERASPTEVFDHLSPRQVLSNYSAMYLARAVDHLRQARQLDGTNSEVRLRLASALTASGQQAEGQKLREEVGSTELSPTQQRRAYLRAQQEAREEARRLRQEDERARSYPDNTPDYRISPARLRFGPVYS